MNPLSTRPNRWRPITVFNLLVGLLFSLSALAQPAFLKEGLVAYYPFNGNANDESGNGKSGSPRNLIYGTDRFERLSKAGVLSQQSPTYIDIPEPTSSFGDQGESATFSIWFKGSVTGDDYTDFLLTSRRANNPVFCDTGCNRIFLWRDQSA